MNPCNFTKSPLRDYYADLGGNITEAILAMSSVTKGSKVSKSQIIPYAFTATSFIFRTLWHYLHSVSSPIFPSISLPLSEEPASQHLWALPSSSWQYPGCHNASNLFQSCHCKISLKQTNAQSQTERCTAEWGHIYRSSYALDRTSWCLQRSHLCLRSGLGGLSPGSAVQHGSIQTWCSYFLNRPSTGSWEIDPNPVHFPKDWSRGKYHTGC